MMLRLQNGAFQQDLFSPDSRIWMSQWAAVVVNRSGHRVALFVLLSRDPAPKEKGRITPPCPLSLGLSSLIQKLTAAEFPSLTL